MEVVSGKALREQSRNYVTNPETGNTYLMRKPLMSDLIKANVLPENFVAQTLVNLGREAQGNAELTDRDLLESEGVQRALVTASMMLPKIVETAIEEDEIEYKDIPASDRNYLFRWCTGKLPAREVETEGGEPVTISQLETFPAEQSGGEPQGSGDNDERRSEQQAQAA
jgi:hypothetical protein